MRQRKSVECVVYLNSIQTLELTFFVFWGNVLWCIPLLRTFMKTQELQVTTNNGILLLAHYSPCSPLPTQSCHGLPMLLLLRGSISCGQCAEECCHANGHTREVRIKGHNPEVCHSSCSFVLHQLTSSLALQDAPLFGLSRSSTNSLLSCTAARCRAVRPSYREGQCQSTLKGLYTVSLP